MALSTLPCVHYLTVHGFDIRPNAIPILPQRVFGHALFIFGRQLICHHGCHFLQASTSRGGLLHCGNEIREICSQERHPFFGHYVSVAGDDMRKVNLLKGI